MGVSYQVILRQIALGAGMLRGSSTAGLQTSYGDTALNQWDLVPDGPYPLSALSDALLDSESLIANAIADTGGHPWRAYLLGFTAALSSGDVMPSTDGDGNPIIGIYGSVLDSADLTYVCTEWPTELIRRWQRMRAYYKSSFYGYALDGNGITHTRAEVVVQVCFYNRETQQTALEANDDMLLPDSLVSALVSGALALLGVKDAPMFQGQFDSTLSAIRSGLTSIPSVTFGGGATLVPAVSS